MQAATYDLGTSSIFPEKYLVFAFSITKKRVPSAEEDPPANTYILPLHLAHGNAGRITLLLHALLVDSVLVAHT
jgi:hypothetical protein